MDQKAAVKALTALAQSRRLAIVRLLLAAGTEGLPAGEIARRIGASPSTLSFHIRILEQAELVTPRRQSRQVIYALAPSRLHAVFDFIVDAPI